ncbi:MAG: AbrB/MazE/SpoVT family DNA-binding domain-containing protein [Nitrospirae bacterium]|nr:AbrB/MazE/SpoVT family DNA-binding domain-containing protein [Nitrospirota bacterium]
MFTTIKKMGSSVAVVIPAIIAKGLNISGGTQIEITEHDGKIIIEPMKNASNTLEDLVGGITQENRHEVASYGCTAGNEVW